MAQLSLRFGKDALIVSRDAAGPLTLETPDADGTSQEQATESPLRFIRGAHFDSTGTVQNKRPANETRASSRLG
jgi:hypothetical protein